MARWPVSAGEGAVVEHRGDQALVLDHEDLGAVAHRHARRLLAAVLEGEEAEVGQVGDRLRRARTRRRRRTPPWGCRRGTRRRAPRRPAPDQCARRAADELRTSIERLVEPCRRRCACGEAGRASASVASRQRHVEQTAARRGVAAGLAEPGRPARRRTARPARPRRRGPAGTHATTRLGDSANSQRVVGAWRVDRRTQSRCAPPSRPAPRPRPSAVSWTPASTPVGDQRRGRGRPAARCASRSSVGRGDRRVRPAPTPTASPASERASAPEHEQRAAVDEAHARGRLVEPVDQPDQCRRPAWDRCRGPGSRCRG